ncbi:MAG TPA: NifB/NifX family molybdenum-iron cluster-binding protein [Phycisphaerae bacterium]|nr:NifB/NifX family molybdenum-iron cluster-binding protein [Phycisphaerae bacterium]
MRIAVASDDGTSIAAHTGRCNGFVVFEIDEGKATRQEYRPNSFTPHARGQCQEGHPHGGHAGHHSHAPLLSAIGDCCALVTRGLGPRLVADLASVGIDTYVCTVPSVDRAAQQYAEGRLPRIEGGGVCDRH